MHEGDWRVMGMHRVHQDVEFEPNAILMLCHVTLWPACENWHAQTRQETHQQMN